ncbi:hypothetical protein D3C76_1335330 [compost metagenome]
MPFQSPSIQGESLSKAGAAGVQVARLKAPRPVNRLRAFRRAAGVKTALSLENGKSGIGKKFLIFFWRMNVNGASKAHGRSVSAMAGVRIMFCYK